jgi:hypothetical protein
VGAKVTYAETVAEYRRLHALVFDGWQGGLPPGGYPETDPDSEADFDGAGIYERFGNTIIAQQYGGVSYRVFASVEDAELFLELARETLT